MILLFLQITTILIILNIESIFCLVRFPHLLPHTSKNNILKNVKDHNQNKNIVKSSKSSPSPSDVVTIHHVYTDSNDHNSTKNDVMIHETFMNMAIQQAKEASLQGEVPIGAIVVKEIIPSNIQSRQQQHDQIIIDTTSNTKNTTTTTRTFQILSQGQNQIETIQDASAHAEMQALRKAALHPTIQNWRLLNSTLYTTLEPCPMCLSASQAFRVNRIVYGANDLRLGAIESYINLLEIRKHPFHDCIDVIGGVKKEECAALLIDFFRERRKASSVSRNKDFNQQSLSSNHLNVTNYDSESVGNNQNRKMRERCGDDCSSLIKSKGSMILSKTRNLARLLKQTISKII